MRIPLSWLKDYLKFDLSNEELENELTLSGLEVDKVECRSFSFKGVVTAQVEKVSPHPHADKLQIATVSDGTESFQVVCGAPNCTAGMKTAFAKIGATLKTDNGKTLKIKKNKLRDIESFGMLCSESELHLSESHEGIMTLEEDTPLGTPISDLFQETIFEISLTPNLGHCMSMLGVARELAALLNLKANKPEFTLQEETTSLKTFEIAIDDPTTCTHYSYRLIKDIKVEQSPAWLKNRLEAAGIRSINNIVDSTNYVMFELGQPLHAFDYQKIHGKKISIELNKKERPFQTLDGTTHTVPPDTLMVCDGKGPIAIAGVMGGAHSEVDEKTTDILLESALFTPKATRRSSKKLNLRSEASSRFEKGVDPEGIVFALDRAAYLIKELSGGQVTKGVKEKIASPFKKCTLKCRHRRINQTLGTNLSLNEIESFFQRLEMETSSCDEETLFVTIPSYRNDIQNEIDLVEEVALMYGYNNIAKSKTKSVYSSLPNSPIFMMENDVRKRLIAEGLQEFLTCDLISPKLSDLGEEEKLSKDEMIHVLHPSSVDQSILRTSLLPGLLQGIKLNLDHQNTSIHAFEIGKIHFKDGSQFKERVSAAVILSGVKRPHHWGITPQPLDFFDLKGIIENLLEGLGIKNHTFAPSLLKSFHPGIQASISSDNGTRFGTLGQVHPERLLKLGLKENIFFAEIDLENLLEASPKTHQMIPLPIYPGSDRDWTLTIKKEIPVIKIFEAIDSIPSKLLKKYFLLDLYENEKLGSDRKNLTLRFTYRNDKQTVEQKQVEKEHSRILETVTKQIEPYLFS